MRYFDRLPGRRAGRRALLTIGFLDHPERFRPQAHAYWRMRLTWIEFADDLPHVDGYSEGVTLPSMIRSTDSSGGRAGGCPGQRGPWWRWSTIGWSRPWPHAGTEATIRDQSTPPWHSVPGDSGLELGDDGVFRGQLGDLVALPSAARRWAVASSSRRRSSSSCRRSGSGCRISSSVCTTGGSSTDSLPSFSRRAVSLPRRISPLIASGVRPRRRATDGIETASNCPHAA